MELNVVDQLSRRGYRFAGIAEFHAAGDIVRRATAMIAAEEGTEYPVSGVVLLKVEYAAPLIFSGYWHGADENWMRTAWRERRQLLDREFDQHVATEGPFGVQH